MLPSLRLYSRMLPCRYPDLRVTIVHDAEAPPQGFISDRHEKAQQYYSVAGTGQQAPQEDFFFSRQAR